jgi:hypothetical protein
MAELKNTFSWSFSQAKDFAECKRRHYLNRYGFWGGWDALASREARQAYRLKQMRNQWALIGDAVDSAILETLNRAVVGAPADETRALERAARSLRSAWKQHQSGKWQHDPKHHVCIRELYYNEISSEPNVERDIWAERVKARTEICIRNFFAHVFPRLNNLGVKDPEHFHLGRVKVYAIPDYVWRKGAAFMIHDWKTGMRRGEHERQLGIYGLWAQTKHNVMPNEITLQVEYLESGETQPIVYDVPTAAAVCEFIMSSVNEMRRYLVGGDLEKNEALPHDEFPKTEDLTRCRLCNYREACNRTFVGAVADE